MADQKRTHSEWLTITWFECNGNFVAIRNFRRIAEFGMPEADKVFYGEGYRVPETLNNISSGRWVFPDQSVFEHSSRDQMGTLFRDKGLTMGQNAVDAASLVFGHSILDYCVNECCRISAAACIGDWEADVEKRKVELAQIRASDYNTVLRQSVDNYVEEQCRSKSLVKRIDLLNRKCQPIPTFVRDDVPYKYDSDKVERIDLRRQEIVHRTAINMALDSVEDDLEYLDATTTYVVNLVTNKYRLPIDVEFWMKHNQKREEIAE